MRPFPFMNKKQLIQAIKKDTQLNNLQINQLITEIFETITNTLDENKKVNLQGFGGFSVCQARPRKGRNPNTGQMITVPARKVVRFQTSRVLKKQIKTNK